MHAMNKTSFCIVIGRMHSSTTPIEEKRPIAAGCDVQPAGTGLNISELWEKFHEHSLRQRQPKQCFIDEAVVDGEQLGVEFDS